MNRHTNGPWVAVEVNPNGHVMTTDGYAIHEHPDFSSIVDAEQIAANGRLIAAAPELLQALSDVFDMCGPQELKDIFGIDWYANAKAAIAKVQGA